MIIRLEEFKYEKRKNKKTQIILCNTLRPHRHYINSLRYRFNGQYDKIPHYVVSKKGEVFSLIPSEYPSNIINKSAVVISLENLGWLQKSMLAPMYNNWIGDVFRGEPHCRRWKDRFFWDVYTPEQMTSLKELIDELCDKYSIPKTFSEHMDMIPQPTKFKGILYRSNFSLLHTDVSPAFDKAEFSKLLEDTNG